MSKKVTIIDLSASMENTANELVPPKIEYWDHRAAAERRAKLGIKPEDFPDGLGLARESVTLITHAGTHFDSPWHFGPKAGGLPSKTIDQVPLEWCYGDGVVLDLRHRKAGESITVEDVKAALAKIKYKLKAWDIVLIMTGADKHMNSPEYPEINPGMSREATLWLVGQGIKVIGTDGYGFDMGIKYMMEQYKSGNKAALWPGHFAGREKEYCHIEKLVNLDKIPRPFGFRVAAFPIKLAKASAGWVRPVAIIEE